MAFYLVFPFRPGKQEHVWLLVGVSWHTNCTDSCVCHLSDFLCIWQLPLFGAGSALDNLPS